MSAADWINPIADALQNSWDYWTGQPMQTPVPTLQGGSSPMASPVIVPPSTTIGDSGYDLFGAEGGGIGFGNGNVVGIPGAGIDAGFQITATNPSGTTLAQSLVKTVTGGSGSGNASTVFLLAGAALLVVLLVRR